MGSITRIAKAGAKAFKGASEVVEAAELGVVGVATAAGVVGVPAYLIWVLMRSGHRAAAMLLIAVVGLIALNFVRDWRRRELSWLSAVVLAIVTVGCVYVAFRIMII